MLRNLHIIGVEGKIACSTYLGTFPLPIFSFALLMNKFLGEKSGLRERF